jgi:hypothetical protein
MEQGLGWLFPVGLGLSALTVLVFLWVLWRLWRTRDFPVVSYGGLSIPDRRVRWLWFIVMTGAFGLGVMQDPILTSNITAEETEEVEGTPVVSTSFLVPLPFYRYEREKEFRGGALVFDQRTTSLLIPWPLPGAFLAYFLLVVRWNPDSRWVRRFLFGRKGG